MGQTGFCENLRFPAVSCENLRFPAVFCENLRPPNAAIPRKSENQQKSAKISETDLAHLSLLVCPFYFPLNSGQNLGISRQKVWFRWIWKVIPNFLAPTPSRGRPPPHPKISGLKSLGLCSFFVPEELPN